MAVKRLLILILGVLLALGATPVAAAPKSDPGVILYQDERVEISYRNVNSAQNEYHAEVTIANLSDTAISDWSLLMDIGDPVSRVSLATFVSQTGRELVVSSGKPNRVIKPGHRVTFWFWAAESDRTQVPPPEWALLLEDGILPSTDSDSDLIPDYIEQQFGTDPHVADTDGDGLSDFIEWTIGTNPSAPDSDGNGTSDAQEDPDSDSVVNIDEVAAGTSLLEDDTDHDGLADGQERVWLTDPLREDTDLDGVVDGAEVAIGSDPLVAEQAFDVTRSVTGHTTSPSVRIEGLRPEQVETFLITQLPEGQPQFPEETPGFIDQGYEFQVSGSFDEAEVSFTFDPDLLGDEFDPAIYAYDEESQRLIEVPNQVIDGNTVTGTVSHFSKYILLNRYKFSKVWLYTFLQKPDDEHAYDRLDVVFTIDSSGSMVWNDAGRERIQVAKNFVDRLGVNDRAAVVDFDSSAVARAGLTNNKSVLFAALDRIDSVGGTNIGAGVSRSLGLFDAPTEGTLRTIILLTDGEGSYDQNLTTQAVNSNVVINTVGLGSSVDVNLLRNIASQTGGEYYPASDAEQLATIFQTISDQADLLRDSDGDGMNDYYEKEMRAGHLVLGNGVPVGLMDPFNPDSDGDGVRDGDEVSINTVVVDSSTTITYAFLHSNPLVVDTDGDGMSDRVDPLPLVFTRAEMLIHQSANREGIRKEPDLGNFQVPPSTQVSDDLTFNDYTFDELRHLGTVFYVAPITPDFMMWSEFHSMLNLGKIGADAEHKTVVDDLYDEFKYGHGGVGNGSVTVDDNFDRSKYHVYSSSALNNAVADSPQMQTYIDQAKSLIVTSIAANHGGTAQLRVQDNLSKNLLYKALATMNIYPIYKKSLTNGNERALAIAIHQFHGHQISLADYRVTGNTFAGTLIFKSYDHFGLDTDDTITSGGFTDWFTLQHFDRFDGKYVPSLTEVKIEVPFSGSF